MSDEETTSMAAKAMLHLDTAYYHAREALEGFKALATKIEGERK